MTDNSSQPKDVPTKFATLLGPGCTYLRPELQNMKLIGIEEHITFPDLIAQVPGTTAEAQQAKQFFQSITSYPSFAYAKGRLNTAGAQRISDMDASGTTAQLLSLSGAVNTTFMEAEDGLKLAQRINDRLKDAVEQYPGRYFAFAELPFQAPELAVSELRRCVIELGFIGAMLTGSVAGTGRFLDDPDFHSILSCFEELDVPLFLHPGIPPPPVVDTYYTIPGQSSLPTALFAGPVWGWHTESAIHVLRLALTGTLDRHPRLKIVIGHNGEMMPSFLHRFDTMFDRDALGLNRTVGETLRDQVWLSISGEFSIPSILVAIQTWGADRIMFGNDYPLVDAQCVPGFLRALGDVVAPNDLRKICQTNAEQLFKIRV